MSLTEATTRRQVTFGEGPCTIQDVVDLAELRAVAVLSDKPATRARFQRGADFVDRLLAEDGVIYGVTTGYGDSCTVVVPPNISPSCRTTVHLSRLRPGRISHARTNARGAGGASASLSQGFSGVSIELLERLTDLLRHDILPLIPDEGSVGASGDLTPLSYVAAILCGEREVMYRGERRKRRVGCGGLDAAALAPERSAGAHERHRRDDGLACLALHAPITCALATRITAMTSLLAARQSGTLRRALFAAKPHVGSSWSPPSARRPRGDATERNEHRLQDRYSLRCAPHVIGVLDDALPWLRSFIEIELNSANDNPIIDAEAERVLHGGHFYGGHIAFAMDRLKNLVANLADLLDRQLALLVDTRYNHGFQPTCPARPGRGRRSTTA